MGLGESLFESIREKQGLLLKWKMYMPLGAQIQIHIDTKIYNDLVYVNSLSENDWKKS